MEIERSTILGMTITWVDYPVLFTQIKHAVRSGEKLLITYANQHILNLFYSSVITRRCYDRFHIIHPDGLGVRIAQLLLNNYVPVQTRVTGTDLYERLAAVVREENFKMFFFGNTQETVGLVSKSFPAANFAGAENGFTFHTGELIERINGSGADILLVGLGAPLQEKWISENVNRINMPVIIAVGDGIKVFSGTKERGPEWLRKAGLEWAVRLMHEPRKLWRRYLIGIPLFMARIFKQKFSPRY